MHSLYGQPDRVAAIMAGAMVETVLERLLVASFKQRSKEREASMLGQGGSLSTFAAKIQIAASFGIISEPMATELGRLKDIRNVFAHAPTNVTFETAEIAELSHNFGMLVAVRAVPSMQKSPFIDKYTGRRGYVLVATILSIMMDQYIKKLGGTPVYSS